MRQRRFHRTKRPAEGAPISSWASSFAKWFGLVVASATLVLTLLGYGHDASYLEQFSLRTDDAQRSPIDYLLRSFWPIAYGSGYLQKVITVVFWQAFAELFWWHTWWVWLGLFAVAAVMSWLGWSARADVRWLLNKLVCLPRVGPWLGAVGSAVTSTARTAARATASAAIGSYRWLKPRLSQRRWFLWSLAGALAGFFLAAGAVLVVWIAGAGFVSVVAAVPAMAVSSGAQRARNDVFNPAQCEVVGVRSGARCLRVLDGSKEVARGRVIDTAGNRVYLLRRCDGAVLTVPLDNRITQTLTSLGDADRRGGPCPDATP
jgi:hypothetical protein